MLVSDFRKMPEQLTLPKVMLVCVDGSEIGFKAAEYAISLAGKLQSRLIFLNVIGIDASEKEYNITADMVGSFETLGEDALNKCQEMAKRAGVQSEAQQVAGDPVEQILGRVAALGCDCIVMGRRELTAAEKLAVESVSQKVLDRADVPVIMVK